MFFLNLGSPPAKTNNLSWEVSCKNLDCVHV